MIELSLTEWEVRVLQEELTECLATNDERRSPSRLHALESVQEKAERAVKDVNGS